MPARSRTNTALLTPREAGAASSAAQTPTAAPSKLGAGRYKAERSSSCRVASFSLSAADDHRSPHLFLPNEQHRGRSSHLLPTTSSHLLPLPRHSCSPPCKHPTRLVLLCLPSNSLRLPRRRSPSSPRHLRQSPRHAFIASRRLQARRRSTRSQHRDEAQRQRLGPGPRPRWRRCAPRPQLIHCTRGTRQAWQLSRMREATGDQLRRRRK